MRALALPLSLLVDECMQNKELVAKLRAAGHDVLTALEGNLIRKPDHAVFQTAIETNRIVITSNCGDFVALSKIRLSKKRGEHPGIFLVYRYNVRAREMSQDDIIKAISNLIDTGIEIANSCHSLNEYNY